MVVKTFRHSGKCGDIIFSLPVIRELGGGIVYIPQNTPDECREMYDNMKDLVSLQPGVIEVKEYPSGYAYMQRAQGVHIDYDLDDARLQKHKGLIHIVKRYFDTFSIKYPNWKEPWLVVDDPYKGDYSIVNYTGRHIVNNQIGIKSRVNWKAVHQSIIGKKYFVGTLQEYQWYHDNIGEIDWLPTTNALELARVVSGAKAVYCNQSLVLALAQGLGKEYYLDVKPAKTNCLLYTKNEHVL